MTHAIAAAKRRQQRAQRLKTIIFIGMLIGIEFGPANAQA
jgi:hypothetical protein